MHDHSSATFERIAGVDEAGRGPLAGPVVAAAVVFPPNYENSRIQDSKKLNAEKRELLFTEIQSAALDWAIVSVGHHRIYAHNILRASLLAMSLALRRIQADRVLVDGNQKIPTTIPQQTVVGGDAIHVQISAASILAKVWRDRLMENIDRRYPGYGFAQHAGYGTASHRNALQTLGPCPVHRRSFRGVVEFFPEKQIALAHGGAW